MNEVVFNTLKKKDFIVKNFLFKVATDMQFSLSETILLIYFMNQEKPVLDIDNIKDTVYLSENDIMEAYDRLTTLGIIEVKIEKDENDKLCEVISLDNIIKSVSSDIAKEEKKALDEGLFEKFETEFGRSLSPMEYEILNNWLSKGISEEMIEEALKEATYNNARSFRYIEKILYSWKEKGYTSKNDVFNGIKQDSRDDVLDLYDFNWLDDNE